MLGQHPSNLRLSIQNGYKMMELFGRHIRSEGIAGCFDDEFVKEIDNEDSNYINRPHSRR
jgi:hypothetical protein